MLLCLLIREVFYFNLFWYELEKFEESSVILFGICKLKRLKYFILFVIFRIFVMVILIFIDLVRKMIVWVVCDILLISF